MIAPIANGLVACRLWLSIREGIVTPLDSLLLDAKQAILDEQHRRWKTLHETGCKEEAARQFHVTLVCAADLLHESLRVLERIAETKTNATTQCPPTPQSSERPDIA
jgi:hypothetical protein